MGIEYYHSFPLRKLSLSAIFIHETEQNIGFYERYLLFDIFYVYEFLLVFMHVHHVHTGPTQVRKGDIWVPGSGFQGNYEQPNRGWELSQVLFKSSQFSLPLRCLSSPTDHDF